MTDSPQSINALFALKRATPQDLVDEPLENSPTKRSVDVYDVPSSKILQRGQSYFDQIYGKVSKRVMGQMDRSGTEDLGITARLMYGYILSNDAVLSPVESSYIIISCLIPQDVIFRILRPEISSCTYADHLAHLGQPSVRLFAPPPSSLPLFLSFSLSRSRKGLN